MSSGDIVFPKRVETNLDGTVDVAVFNSVRTRDSLCSVNMIRYNSCDIQMREEREEEEEEEEVRTVKERQVALGRTG